MKTFKFALKCPKCWGNALFANVSPELGQIVETEMFYDRHGAAPIPGPQKEALCPLCGGYLAFWQVFLQETSPGERAELVSANAH